MSWMEIENYVRQLLRNKCCCNLRFYSESDPKPTTGKQEVLYIDKDTGDQFIWNGTVYVAL